WHFVYYKGICVIPGRTEYEAWGGGVMERPTCPTIMDGDAYLLFYVEKLEEYADHLESRVRKLEEVAGEYRISKQNILWAGMGVYLVDGLDDRCPVLFLSRWSQ
ncbi:MAG: hypothetical protein JSV36_22520, partial [Anaerolineae bacterium]